MEPQAKTPPNSPEPSAGTPPDAAEPSVEQVSVDESSHGTPAPRAPTPAKPIPPWLQWAVPPALRLDEQPMECFLPDAVGLFAMAAELYRAAQPAKTAAPVETLVELAVETWRLKKRVAKLAGLDAESLRNLHDSVLKLENLHKRDGVEAHDHTGERYVDGMLAVHPQFEPIAGLEEGQQKIIETIRPSVTLHGQLAARGEVVVGVPESDAGKEGENDGARNL